MKISPSIYIHIGNELQKLKSSKREAYLQRLSAELGKSTKTIRRNVIRYGKFSSGRKPRKDAFQIDPETNEHLNQIIKIYTYQFDKNSRYPIRWAVDHYLRSFPQDKRPKLPSISWITDMIRRKGLNRASEKKQDPSIILKTNYPNEAHQLDFSLLYCILDEKIIPIFNRDANKNKPELLNHPKRLILMMLTDHFTGAFFPLICRKQKILDIAKFLYLAWMPKGDKYPFHGVPEYLLTDNDKALRSFAMLRLFDYLEIKVPNVRPYKARVKGSVEKTIDIFQRFFESKLRFINGPITLEEINKLAIQEAIYFQTHFNHSRHLNPRFQFWVNHIENHLRELPNEEIYKQMLYCEPISRLVNSAGRFKFKPKDGPILQYFCKGIYNEYVDLYLHPFRFEKDFAITLQYPSRIKSRKDIPPDQIQTITLTPENINHISKIPENSVHIGEYAAIPETTRQKNKKILEKVELNKTTLDPRNLHSPKTPSFLPLIGRQIQNVSNIGACEIKFNKIQTKARIVDHFRRPFLQSELKIIDDYFVLNETATDKEITQLIEKIKSINILRGDQ